MAEEEYEGNSSYTGGAPPGQGFNERGFGGNSVVIPEAEEVALLTDLKDNLKQTYKFQKQLKEDKEKLGGTFNECMQIVESQFNALRTLLDNREKVHMEMLNAKFAERDDKLQEQIDALESHYKQNQQCKQQCIHLVATMDEPHQEEERLKMIQNNINTCIADSPQIQQVPIQLKFAFDTEKELKKIIDDYGKLDFRRMTSGRKMPYTRLGARVVTGKSLAQPRRPGAARAAAAAVPAEEEDNKEEEILLPNLDKFVIKYDKKADQFRCEVKVTDLDKTKLKAAQVNLYDSIKQNNAFVQVQCIADPTKEVNFDAGDIHLEQFLSLSKMLDGKKYIGDLEKSDRYEPENFVVGRARIVYLDDETETENIRKEGAWSAPNSVKYRPAAGGANGANGAGAGAGAGPGEVEERIEAAVPDVSQLPDKVSFKVNIIAGDARRDGKSVILKRDTYNYDALVDKIRGAPIIRRIGNLSAHFDIVVKGSDAKVSNDNELIANVLAKAIGVDKGKIDVVLEATML